MGWDPKAGPSPYAAEYSDLPAWPLDLAERMLINGIAANLSSYRRERAAVLARLAELRAGAGGRRREGEEVRSLRLGYLTDVIELRRWIARFRLRLRNIRDAREAVLETMRETGRKEGAE